MHRSIHPQIFIIFTALLALAILSCAGFSNLPNPFATQTPTPTNTFTPTATSTVTPSPTATLTPTATPRPTGMVIKEQTDGTTLVIDYDNRYQFILPAQWKVAFSSQKDLVEAIRDQGDDNPDFAQLADNFKDVDPDIFRLAALNVNRNYVQAGFPTVLTMNAFSDTMASSMPMAFVTAMIEDNTLQGSTSTTWDVVTSASNVEVGIVRGSRTLHLPNGVSVTVQELVIAFQANDKLILMEIVAPKQFAEQLLTPFEQVATSIQIDSP